MSEREPNVYYNPLWSSSILFLLYSFPVYILGGIPSSYFIEKCVPGNQVESKIKLYITKFGLYGLAGAIVGFIYLMVLTIPENKMYLILGELKSFLLLGLLAALVFYHVSLLFRKYS